MKCVTCVKCVLCVKLGTKCAKCVKFGMKCVKYSRGRQGLALMSIATLVADAMICYLLSDDETRVFRKRKYEVS